MSVELVEVYKIYKTGEIDLVALRGISTFINGGEFVVVMGPSGSGKTTLLNLISGLDNPTSGKIFVDDTDLTQLNEGEKLLLRRNKIGFIFQFFNLIPFLTAWENIEFPMIIKGLPREERKKRVKELLNIIDLQDRSEHKPYQLSGGEQQRVAIAMALAHEPKILLADEPTGELDSENTVDIGKLLKEINDEKGTTIISATHDPLFASFGKRLIELKDGMIMDDRLKSALEVPISKEGIVKDVERLRNLIDSKGKTMIEIENLKKAYFDGKIGDDEYIKKLSALKESLNRIEGEIRKLKNKMKS